MTNYFKEVEDFFSSTNRSDLFFKHVFPSILEDFGYRKEMYNNKQLKARILVESVKHMLIPGITSYGLLAMLCPDAATLLRDLLIYRTKWWFKHYVPYNEYKSC